MLRKRYYILFVARDEDGQRPQDSRPSQVRIRFPGCGCGGSLHDRGAGGIYTRMLLKTESYNQVRQERETLRKNYQQMAADCA